MPKTDVAAVVDQPTPLSARVIAGLVDGVRIFRGYAGWGPGQLEGEIDSGSWLVVDARPDDVFDAAVEPGSVVASLVAGGIDELVADGFVSAARAVRSTSTVTVLHRPTSSEIVGVELTWLDAGPLGLWLTEPSGSPSRRLIERVTAADLAIRLRSYLPFG